MRSRVRETRRAHEVEGITQRREAVALRVREDRGEHELTRNLGNWTSPPHPRVARTQALRLIPATD